MSLELYDDRVIFDLYNAETNEAEEVEFDDQRGIKHRGRSHLTQLLAAVSHWCPVCECAFRKEDMTEVGSVCPICETELDEFDLEAIVPDMSLDIEQDEEGNWS